MSDSMSDRLSIPLEHYSKSDEFARAAAELCRDRLGREVLGYVRAGWPGNPAVRVQLEDAPVIVTRRTDPERTRCADRTGRRRGAGAENPRL